MALVLECPPGYPCDGRVPVGRGYYIPANPWRLREELEAYRWSLLILFGAFAWEIIVTFPEEWSRWRQLFRKQMVPINACVLTARWSAWAAVVTVILYAFGRFDMNCQATLSVLMTFVALCAISLSLIQHIRVTALHVRSVRARQFVTLMALAHAGVWIASITGFRAGPTNPAIKQPGFPSCSPLPSPRWRAMGWGGSMVYDIVVFWFTLSGTGAIQKNIRHATGGKHVIHLLHGSAWINFLVTFSGNAACFFTTIFSNNLILSNIPIAISTLINVIIAARVVFHSISWQEGSDILLVGPQRRRRTAAGAEIEEHISAHIPASGSGGSATVGRVVITNTTADLESQKGGHSADGAGLGLPARLLGSFSRRGSDANNKSSNAGGGGGGFRFSTPRLLSVAKGHSPTLEEKEYEDAVFRGRISTRRGSEPASASAYGTPTPSSKATMTPELDADMSPVTGNVQWTYPNVFTATRAMTGTAGSDSTSQSSHARGNAGTPVPPPAGSGAGAAPYDTYAPPPPASRGLGRTASNAPGIVRSSTSTTDSHGIQVHKEVFRITH